VIVVYVILDIYTGRAKTKFKKKEKL
jgi:hypothetical protein